jgi:hypothetical protein
MGKEECFAGTGHGIPYTSICTRDVNDTTVPINEFYDRGCIKIIMVDE